jgi:uncharacterized protein YbcI
MTLSGGELNAAITRELVRIHATAIGRGPKKSYSFHNGDVLVTVLLEVQTRAERALIANDEADTVLRTRRVLQRTMEKEMVEAVARLTGRAVIASMADNHVDPDMAVHVFILDPPLT